MRTTDAPRDPRNRDLWASLRFELDPHEMRVLRRKAIHRHYADWTLAELRAEVAWLRDIEADR